MKFKERKALGLMPFQVLRQIKQLCRSGEITRDMSRKEAAVVVATWLASQEDTCEAWEKIEYGSVDWDKLLAFIEKLLAVLLPLFLPPV